MNDTRYVIAIIVAFSKSTILRHIQWLHASDMKIERGHVFNITYSSIEQNNQIRYVWKVSHTLHRSRDLWDGNFYVCMCVWFHFHPNCHLSFEYLLTIRCWHFVHHKAQMIYILDFLKLNFAQHVRPKTLSERSKKKRPTVAYRIQLAQEFSQFHTMLLNLMEIFFVHLVLHFFFFSRARE